MNFLKLAIGVLKYHQAKKSGKCLRIKVSQFSDIFRRLDAEKIDYVVLRGLSTDGSRIPNDDIDLLIDISKKNKYKTALIFARYYSKSGIPIDLYSVCSIRGFLFRGYPYYPPMLAREIMHARTKVGDAYVLEGEMKIKSLVYHLLYQKMPYGNGDSQKKLVDQIIALAGGRLTAAQLNSAEFLESWLKQNQFAMPFDLKCKFTSNAFFNHLVQADAERCGTGGNEDPDACLFVRTDVYPAAWEQVFEEVSEKFDITHRFVLVDESQQLQAAKKFRGGNWFEGSVNQLFAPAVILFVKFRIAPNGISDYASLQAWKEAFREAIGEKMSSRVYGLHSSDSKIEALHALETCLELYVQNKPD
jgi:hypothetical protein